MKRILTVVALLAAAAPAQAQRPFGSSSSGSAAAMTSLVVVPTTDLRLINTRLQMKGYINLGARLEWLPRAPWAVSVVGGRELAGNTGSSTFELGAGWRWHDNLHESGEWVNTDNRLFANGDSVLHVFRGVDATVHSYDLVRAGFTTMSNNDGPSLGQTATASAFYVGISHNTLVNEAGGLMGSRVIRSLGADLLLGSPDSTALKSSKLGFRGWWATGWGNVFGTRLEIGSQPGRGTYGFFAVDWYLMFENVLR